MKLYVVYQIFSKHNI